MKWGLYDARFGAAVRTRLSFAKRDNVELFSVLNFAITFYFGCKGNLFYQFKHPLCGKKTIYFTNKAG